MIDAARERVGEAAAKRCAPLRTLKAIRQNAPEQDRNDAALRLAARPLPPAPLRPNPSAIRYDGPWPETHHELKVWAKDYGEAAVAEALWSSILIWLTNPARVPPVGLTNDITVAANVAEMIREHHRFHLGWPCKRLDVLPALDRLNLDCRREAERVAAETLADWERLGDPALAKTRIIQAYHMLRISPAWAASYPETDPHQEKAA